MNLKVKENLFIIGNRVVSYETAVATIKDGRIVAHGKYSRSTGKQLGYLSRLTGLPLQCSNEKRAFYQFELGVRCSSPGKINISLRGAQKILSQMKYEQDIVKAAAIAYSSLSVVDRAFVKIELWKKGWTNEEIEACAVLELIGI